MSVEVDLQILAEPFVVPGGPSPFAFWLLQVVVSIALGYWIYTDEKRRGSADPLLWAVIVGGFVYLSVAVGLAAVVIYIWRREQRTGGIGPGRDR